MKILILLFIALSICLPQISFAQELDETLFFEEEEIVVTASKEKQKISEAPAIIDVITEAQIRDFGVTNLYELISFLPGIENMETFFGRTSLNFRGILNGHYNNKVLLMIDSNPVYETINGTYFLESVPLSSISRIEVIRGPGSPLYGTNAYSGVINIITKKGNKEPKNLVTKIGGGSFSTVNLDISGNYKLSEDSGIFISAELLNSDGYEFNVVSDEADKSGNWDYQDKIIRGLGNLTYKNLFLQFGFFNQEKMTYGITPNLNFSGIHHNTSFWVNGSYQHDLNAKNRLTLHIRYSLFDVPEADIGHFPTVGFTGHEESRVHLEFGGDYLGTEIQVNSQLNEKFTTVLGIVYESFYSDRYIFVWDSDGALHLFSAYVEEHYNYKVGGYFQFDYQPFPKFCVIGGGRITEDEDTEETFFSPRIGFIYKPKNNISFKALYGNAFRSPTFFEKYVSTYDVLYGSTDLEPEKINTIDVGVEADFYKYFKVRLNGFFETTKDGIVRAPTDNPYEQGEKAAIYINASEEEIYGAEFAAQGKMKKGSYYGFNFSWKNGEDRDSGEELLNFAHITSNFWLKYDLYENFYVMPNAQFIGERKGWSERENDFTLDPYALLNLTCGVNWGEMDFTVSGKNLLDEDYSYPEYVRQKSEEVPGGAGIHFMGSLRYRF